MPLPSLSLAGSGNSPVSWVRRQHASRPRSGGRSRPWPAPPRTAGRRGRRSGSRPGRAWTAPRGTPGRPWRGGDAVGEVFLFLFLFQLRDPLVAVPAGAGPLRTLETQRRGGLPDGAQSYAYPRGAAGFGCVTASGPRSPGDGG